MVSYLIDKNHKTNMNQISISNVSRSKSVLTTLQWNKYKLKWQQTMQNNQKNNKSLALHATGLMKFFTYINLYVLNLFLKGLVPVVLVRSKRKAVHSSGARSKATDCTPPAPAKSRLQKPHPCRPRGVGWHTKGLWKVSGTMQCIKGVWLILLLLSNTQWNCL